MIDIIIPAYNSHKTILKTLYSIINQKNKDELNVLIVDDCSDNNYNEICEFYSNYIKINTIRLEKNSGPGVARQVGLENTHNEYIIFIDADDEFADEESLKVLKDSIDNCDISFGQMFQESTNQVLHHEECLHGKMFRRSFLKSKNIKFNSLRSHEDNAFSQLCLCTAKKINYIQKLVYIYHNQTGSITNTIDFYENLKILVKSMNWLFDNIESQKYVDKHYTGIVITAIMLYFYFCYVSSNEEYTYIIENLSYLKNMYIKYGKYINEEERLNLYKEFEITIIPKITFYQFIERL